MNKKKLTMVFGLIGLMVVASGAYLYTLIEKAGDMWPSLNKPGSLTFVNNRLQGEVNALRQEVAKIPDAEKRLEEISIDYDLAARVLPRESSPDQLIAAIRTKAQQAGVTPSRLTPSVTRARGGKGGEGAFETWRFALSVDGNYDQLATFVNRMEEFDSSDATRTGSEKRFFEVKSITITAQENGLGGLTPASVNKPVMHKCTMNMQTYRYIGE